MGQILGQISTLQQQVESLVECSVEESAAGRTTQVALHQADFHLKNLSGYLDRVVSGYLGALDISNDCHECLLSGIGVGKPQSSLQNIEDPVLLKT